jgi:hypothetical protein
MEADWIRLRSIATVPLKDQKTRRWFVAEVPDEDENSGDDDWLHVADVFTTTQDGVVTQVEVCRASDVDATFEQDSRNGRLEEVIFELLRPFEGIQFALDVSLSRSTLEKEPALIYHSDLGILA